MTEASKMNPFKKRLYDEFEDHAYKVLGVSGDRVREVLVERGHDTDADFEAAYEFAGASLLRNKNWSAANMETRDLSTIQIGKLVSTWRSQMPTITLLSVRRRQKRKRARLGSHG